MMASTLETLETGEVEVLGLLPYSSNYVFLANARRAGTTVLAVYKPMRGERPLWDFPPGTLAAREVAAYKVSVAAGWNFVPPTVLRADAPLGAGSLQLFIEHDPDDHFFSLVEERQDDFRSFAAFDAVINNADRKGGHVLRDNNDSLWGVDHGLSFNVEPKLRTVIWIFAEQEFRVAERRVLERLMDALCDRHGLRGELSRLLSEREAAATRARVEELLTDGCFPYPRSQHHLPWPLI